MSDVLQVAHNKTYLAHPCICNVNSKEAACGALCFLYAISSKRCLFIRLYPLRCTKLLIRMPQAWNALLSWSFCTNRWSSEPPAELQLTCLAEQSYHLSGLEQGLHAFQPVVFASPNLAVCNLTVHSLVLQQMEGKIAYRASDDIEGELGRQIDSCMHSVLSQCWGGPSIQSVNPKRAVSQAQSKADHFSHQQDGIQLNQGMMTKSGPDRQAQSKQAPSGSMQSDGIKRGPATPSHAVYSMFDPLPDMEQDQEESVVKSWSSGVNILQESQPVKHEDEGLEVRQYNSIRAVLAGNAESGNSQNPGNLQQSAQALSRLLITFATSPCYPQLQLLKIKLIKSADASSSSKPIDQSLGRPAAAKAEAIAADWVCLMWLLQKAPEEVARGLKAEWQKGQVQEFATWVRPASELNAVRSKAAAKLMRQQLRELSTTSQSRPSSSKPSMANLTIQIGHSPLSITSPNGPNPLGQPKGLQHVPGLLPSKASPGTSSVQPSSPSRLWPGSTPPLHPTSPTRGAAGLISPVQRSTPSKGGLRWGRWGQSPHPSQANSPHVQSSDPSRNWPGEAGSPVVQSSSPSRNWVGPEANLLVQSTSPSRNWAGPGGNWGVQSSSPSRAWGAATPPVQSSAPSFLKGWLSKQRGHSVAEELAMEAFRLQLALQAGQLEPAGPCMLDERLHVKPHHQPILFVDDSMAPNLQLPPKVSGQVAPKYQIAASHVITATGRPCGAESDQESPPRGGFRTPPRESAVSLDEAESISSSPRSSPLRLMQRLMSHSKGPAFGHSHAGKHAAAAKAADSRDMSATSIQANDSSFVRQGSSGSSSSPSHGPDSRFAAMKSLTRHAISLDSPTKLETCRRRGTLVPRKALAAGRSLESGLDQLPAGYDFDLGINLSPASSAENSAASSFTDAHSASGSAGLMHLHSAPVLSSREASITQAVAEQRLAALDMGASPTAALLGAAHQLGSTAEQAVASTADHAVAQLMSRGDAAIGREHSSSGAALAGAASLHDRSRPDGSLLDAAPPIRVLNDRFRPASSASEPSHSRAKPVASAGIIHTAAADAAISASHNAAADALMLPLSPDSLDLSLVDPESFLEPQDSEDQQLLDGSAGMSSSQQGSQQLHDVAVHTSPSAKDARQVFQQTADACSLVQESQQLLEQPVHTSSSAQASQQLLEPADYSPFAQEDQQLLQQLTCSLAQEDQQQLLEPTAGDSSSAQDDHQQLREQLPIEASHLEVVSSSQSLGHAWPMDPDQDKQHKLDFPTSTSAQQAGAVAGFDPGCVLMTSGPLDAVDSITAGTAAGSSETSDGNIAAPTSDRHQGVARVLSKLPSLQSMTQRLRATSHKAMLPGTVDEAKEEHRLVASVSISEAHVVVFVHGFRGSARDLGAVRSHMQLAQPDLDYLMSNCNQDRTAEGLQTMGHRLAAEVAQYLQGFENGKQRRLDKLSFVGHSIGNLIIRAALTEPVLKVYLPCLWLFLSLSGPHLGYLCSANKLFCSGMWLFKKFTAGRTLHELTFTDAPELQECYLHNLAAAPSLTLFKCVLLAASPQDQYVPFDSTRIQSPKAEQQGRRATAQREMARKLLYGADGGQNTRLIRVDVDFPVKQWKSVNNAVGRTAHLAFVESEAFIRFLVWSVLQPRQLI
ncbi:hypothetical protein WJX77_005511 [Trebouxia sp. C0004]